MKINFKIKNEEKEIKLLVSEKVFKPTQTTKLLLEQSIKKIKKKKIKNFRYGLWKWCNWNLYIKKI